jgi:N-acetylglucosamine kinase-like BadF-type ATPase
MASKKEDNLIPLNKRTKSEQRKIATAGGKKSGEVRRQKKLLKDCFDILLDKEYENKQGNKQSGSEVLASVVFKKAMAGDLKAFEILRDTAGQKPVEKVILAEVDQSTIDEVESMVLGTDNADKKTSG